MSSNLVVVAILALVVPFQYAASDEKPAAVKEYQGTVVDESDQPVADCLVRLVDNVDSTPKYIDVRTNSKGELLRIRNRILYDQKFDRTR